MIREPEAAEHLLACSRLGCEDPVVGWLEVTVLDRPGLSFRDSVRHHRLGLCATDMDRAQRSVPAVSTEYKAADGNPWRGGVGRRYV